MYRAQHYERIRIPKVPAHLNQNLNVVSKSVDVLLNYILLTINMSEKPKIGIKNRTIYRILWNDQIAQIGRKYSLISLIFTACL